MNAKIIPISELYRNKLISFLRQKYSTYSDAFIEFEVNEAISNAKEPKSIIVVNENDEIVGCHFYFNTKAWINGEERNACWGHNTYLEQEFRHIIGLDFVLKIIAVRNGFGYGLTDINYKIQKLVKGNIFINGLRKYCKLNIWFIWDKSFKLLGKQFLIPSSLPPSVNYREDVFQLCLDANEIKIPNGGFWYKNICEVDFIRDEEFLNKRFFFNPVNKYYVYTNQDKDLYFVVRPILHNGIPSIQVADFRYLPTQQDKVSHIFHAIEKLCRTLRIGIMLFTTSERNVKNLYERRWLCKSYPVAFVGGKKVISSEDAYIIVNAADSDDEYYAGE